MTKVLVTDFAWPNLDVERSVLTEAEIVVAERGNEDELVALAADASAILTNWRSVPARALEQATSCVVVSRYGVGVDNIPVDVATALGILVTNVPTFCVDEVSDHVMALLLASARRIAALAAQTRQGIWDISSARGIPRLRGQTLSLIGFGNIARATVPKARGFGLEVVAYARRPVERLPDGVTVTHDLEEALAAGDYVSLHLPANEATRKIIGDRAFSVMRRNACLINTARGGLVDEDALYRALKSGRLAGAALDVLSREPPADADPLLALPTVIVTPHSAFYSEAAIADVTRGAAENVASVLAGVVPRHLVNPNVLNAPNLRAAMRT